METSLGDCDRCASGWGQGWGGDQNTVAAVRLGRILAKLQEPRLLFFRPVICAGSASGVVALASPTSLIFRCAKRLAPSAPKPCAKPIKIAFPREMDAILILSALENIGPGRLVWKTLL